MLDQQRIINRFIFYILTALTLSSCSQYYGIDSGIDFATGESIQTKRTLDNTPKLIWTKRYPGCKEFYEKYGLSYPNPIIFYFCGTEYSEHGTICWDGAPCEYYRFFDIIRWYKPSTEEANEIFKHCIEMYERKAKQEEVKAYLTGRFNHYNDPLMKKLLLEIMKDTGNPQNIFKFRDNQRQLVDYLKRHRKEYPPKLNKGFLDLIQEYDRSDFFLMEYLYYPSKENAFRLGYSLCGNDDYFDENLISSAFIELEKAKKLDEFLAIALPPVMPPLPPEASHDSGLIRLDQHTSETMKGLTHREAALRFAVQHKHIKTYYKQKKKR
jgi:hypothetical protein